MMTNVTFRASLSSIGQVVVATAVGLLLSSASYATSITNGSFEDVQITSSFSASPADIPGWTHTGADGDALLISTLFPTCCGGTNSSKAGDGNQFVILGGGFTTPGGAAWSQTLNGLIVGQPYVVSFDMAAEGETPTQQMTVGITSGSLTPSETFTSLVTSTLFWQNWGSDQYTFVPTASSATLQFSVANQQFDVGLDAVSIAPSAPTAVPEPASMLLLGTGLLGMGARRWRNRRQRS